MKNYKNFLPEADLKRSMSSSYGTYQGYYLTINSYTNNSYRVTISASKANEDDYTELKRFLADFGNMRKNVKAIYYENAAIVMEVVPSFCKNIFKAITECVPEIIAYLRREMYTSGCEICGEPNVENYMINKDSHYLCSNCSNEVVQAFEENKQNKRSQKSKFVPGLIGAILGSLIGVICWAVVFKLGYIAAISGIVMVICSAKGYELLGGNVDIKGIISVCIISIIMLYFANKLSWTWEAYDAFIEQGDSVSFFDIYKNIMDLIKYSDLTSEFMMDLGLGYLFAVFGAASTVVSYIRAAKGNYKLVKSK